MHCKNGSDSDRSMTIRPGIEIPECRPDLFSRRWVGSDIVQAKRIRVNASVSEAMHLKRIRFGSVNGHPARNNFKCWMWSQSICFTIGGSDLASFRPNGSGITHRYRKRKDVEKRIRFGSVDEHPARNRNSGCGPYLSPEAIGSSFFQAKRIRDNA